MPSRGILSQVNSHAVRVVGQERRGFAAPYAERLTTACIGHYYTNWYTFELICRVKPDALIRWPGGRSDAAGQAGRSTGVTEEGQLARWILRATEVIRISSPDGAFSLGLLHRASSAPRGALPPMLVVHGATLGASVFDLPLSGYSLLAHLAARGRNVYAVDIRGFGHSAIDLSARALRCPFPSTADAVSDISAAANAIRARERSDVIDLVGFSWGCIPAVRHAAANAAQVARLALYAPLYGERNPAWLDLIADRSDRTRLRDDFGVYRSMALSDLERRWNREIGNADVEAYREAGVLECAFQTLCASGRHPLADGTPAFRCPTGPLADLVDTFNGRRLYDATRITMPTLIVRGADDTTATDADARSLLADIRARSKSYAAIPGASHFLLLERKRTALYAALDDFFAAREKPKHVLHEDIL